MSPNAEMLRTVDEPRAPGDFHGKAKRPCYFQLMTHTLRNSLSLGLALALATLTVSAAALAEDSDQEELLQELEFDEDQSLSYYQHETYGLEDESYTTLRYDSEGAMTHLEVDGYSVVVEPDQQVSYVEGSLLPQWDLDAAGLAFQSHLADDEEADAIGGRLGSTALKAEGSDRG